MLMPLPATLRRLVKDYEALAADQSAAAAATSSARLRDLAYTLCVSTGTREVFDALQVARTYLGSATARPVPGECFPGSPGPAESPARLSGSEPQTLYPRAPIRRASDAAAAHRSAAADFQHPSKPAVASHWAASRLPRTQRGPA
ncbi:DUF5133 domain-containing protein [Streptomyces sp. NPDC048253]|uniref:DUF5133 domain-containing protein n=1 Tax=Streptomyces sp. NPDC048253 TaxID=3365524 RepID=UPI003710BE9F